MKKVVINSHYGGLGLSYEGVMKYAELKGIKLYPYTYDFTKRIYSENIKPEEAGLLFYSTMPVSNEKELNQHYFSPRDIARDDPYLVKVVELLGVKANGSCAKLKVIEIPTDIEWEIEKYDGIEWIAEKHRTWE